MTGWPVEYAGDEYRPVPESWIEHGIDQGQGDPRLYAVSVAHRGRMQLVVRYLNPRADEILHATMAGVDRDKGIVPCLLVKGEWPRSLVPTPVVEPADVPRGPEREHLRELWSDRVEAVQGEQEIVADGGERVDGAEQAECTTMECSGEAEYAYWMPDFGHFSRVRSPEHGLLEDGDLCPYVCEACRDRMVASPHWDGDRFVRPEEKLIADGGQVKDGIEREERAKIAVKLREKTDLTLREIGEIVDRSDSWVLQEIHSTETDTDHDDDIRADGGQVWITVHATGARNRDLHTDEDCPRLQDATDYRPTDPEKHLNKELCSLCTGEWEPHDGGSSGLHEQLADLDPADVGGDGRVV